MARLPRVALPGCVHHVMQRGNNGQRIFETAADYQRILDLLGEHSRKFRVAVHAYVLMGNHFHLLVTPLVVTGLSQMMQAVGRQYVRYFNDVHQRTGTLWDGRYRSTVIEAERFLLADMVYLDQSPVRDGLVAQAGEYPWSSFGHYAGQRVDKLLTVHPLVWGLGNTPFAREAAYTEMVQVGINAVQQEALRNAVLSGWPLGTPEFVDILQKTTPRRLTKSSPGRPSAERKTQE
jgi:putative transposase